MTELTWQRKIGEILLERKVVSADQLEEALKIQQMILKPIGRILIDMEVTTEDQIAEALAEQKGFVRISLKEYRINKQAVALFPLPMARLHKALPIDFKEGNIILAMADPLDVYAIDDVRMITGSEVRPVVCTETEIIEIIDGYLAGVVRPAEEEIGRVLEEKLSKLQKAAKASIDDFVDSAVELAYEKGVSNIYFEPDGQGSRLRFRLNGELHDVMTLNEDQHEKAVTHLKKVFGVDSNGQGSKKIAQITLANKKLDLEAIVLQGVSSADVCLKILHAGKESKELENLGLRQNDFVNLISAFSRRSGLVLGVQVPSNGETGNDMTSLFGTVLKMLISSKKRIIAVGGDSMPEIRGVVRIGPSPQPTRLSRRSLLTAILESDAEVLAVDSLEDGGSVDLLVEAGLQGVLVLTALPRQNALSGLVDFVKMSSTPVLAAESLKCVVGQKNVKRLCGYCRKSYEPKTETLELLSQKAGFKIVLGKAESFFTAGGCEHCNNTGFSGTIGIFETIPVSDAIRKALAQEKDSEEIRQIAEKEGIGNHVQDAYHKAAEGEISFEEFVKQIG